jgi:hypothetical protein
MREKAELTDEARRLIETILIDSRSEDFSTRQEARFAIIKVQILYGREALEVVEEELATRFGEMQAGVWG